ncbi:MAG: hypothetical protein QOJ21_3828 [Solirubrobacteraceae bacterium]|jgi:hypothetical protein|nr:hypothetical protein [Solirubrobacteraceae bacterium]
MRRLLRACARAPARSVAVRALTPLVLEAAALSALAVAIAAMFALVTAGEHVALVLLACPAATGLRTWARRWRPPGSTLRDGRRRLAADARRRVLLVDAIDRAPHRHARTPAAMHDLYGPFVERRGAEVAVQLLRRPLCARRERVRCTTVAEERRFTGDDVERAAAYLTELEDRAADLECRERERLAGDRSEQQRRREAAGIAAEAAMVREIEQAHEEDLQRRERELDAEDRRARRRDAELEAEALARALRRR